MRRLEVGYQAVARHATKTTRVEPILGVRAMGTTPQVGWRRQSATTSKADLPPRFEFTRSGALRSGYARTHPATIRGLDESIAFGNVEPFDGSSRHVD
jgi:hypothetical protein